MLHLFFFDKQSFYDNPLLNVNYTSEESFEGKLFNPFDFQQIMDVEGNDPDLSFFNDHSEAVTSLYYTID